MMKYNNVESSAYRTLQRVMNEAMDDGQDEYSDEEGSTSSDTSKMFQLPKRLSGWLFLERGQIPVNERSGILNLTGGMHIWQTEDCHGRITPGKGP